MSRLYRFSLFIIVLLFSSQRAYSATLVADVAADAETSSEAKLSTNSVEGCTVCPHIGLNAEESTPTREVASNRREQEKKLTEQIEAALQLKEAEKLNFLRHFIQKNSERLSKKNIIKLFDFIFDSLDSPMARIELINQFFLERDDDLAYDVFFSVLLKNENFEKLPQEDYLTPETRSSYNRLSPDRLRLKKLPLGDSFIVDTLNARYEVLDVINHPNFDPQSFKRVLISLLSPRLNGSRVESRKSLHAASIKADELVTIIEAKRALQW